MQDRFPNIYVNQNQPLPEQANVYENVPSGAIEYHNPSTETKVNPIDSQYYPQVPTIRPEIHSISQILSRPDEEPESPAVSTQTEKTFDPNVQTVQTADNSHSEANEYVTTNTDSDTAASQESTVKEQNLSFDKKRPYNDVQKQEGSIVTGVSFEADHQDLPVIQGKPFSNYHQKQSAQDNKNSYQPDKNDDTVDLKPPAIITHYRPDSERRPVLRPRPVSFSRPESTTHLLDSRPKRPINRTDAATLIFGSKFAVSRPNFNKEEMTHNTSLPGGITTTRVHPDYPHILTKPKPQVPAPITISTGSSLKTDNSRLNKVKVSLHIKEIGEDVDSKTQTERLPSMLLKKYENKKPDVSFETASQTNFANSESDSKDKIVQSRPGDIKTGTQTPKVPSQTMTPPPLRRQEKPAIKDEKNALKPPPLPSDVVGMSPPLVDITTTNIPPALPNDSVLRTSPKYIPLKESVTPPPPSVSMVPPNPKPSVSRPFLVELLSQVKL